MYKPEIEASMNDEDVESMKNNRAVQRRTEFLLNTFKAIENEEHLQDVLNNGKRKLILRFFMSPEEVLTNEDNELMGMKFSRHQKYLDQYPE